MLYIAVGANRVCNGAPAVGAEFIVVALWNNSDERWRWGKFSKTEINLKNVQHNSAATHTHKCQILHTAVGANRVGDGARAVVAEEIAELWNNADERWRWGKFSKTEITLKKRAAQFSDNTYAQVSDTAHCCWCESRLQWRACRRRRCYQNGYCHPVKQSG
jgi:hypothetical protein